MKVLIIFNREPYDSTDVTRNGLRLADTLREKRTRSKNLPNE